MNEVLEMNMNMGFLIKAALSDSLISSFQRAKIYAEDITDTHKMPLKNSFKSQLRQLESGYVSATVDDERHIENIKQFADLLSEDFGDILQNRRFRLGIAQKGVNLFLKYLWSFGLISEPPHCPIDAIVLRAIRYDAKWTQLDSVEMYKDIIENIRQVAGSQSLSEWELELWNRVA